MNVDYLAAVAARVRAAAARKAQQVKDAEEARRAALDAAAGYVSAKEEADAAGEGQFPGYDFS